jgi:hypothetical protein
MRRMSVVVAVVVKVEREREREVVEMVACGRGRADRIYRYV